MINFDNYANENKTKHNKNWQYIPDHLYRILIMILKLLLNIQTICMIFTKILMNTILVRKIRY